MNNATDRPLYQYLIGDLRIVELRSLAYGQTWTVFRDLNIIAVLVDLTEDERTRALGEALSELAGLAGAGTTGGAQ